MKLRGGVGLLLAMLTIQIPFVQGASSLEVNRKLEASSLKSGYAIRLLKPLPRRNSGCETIFRSGKVLESCEPNYGFDPAIEGVIRNYCEWNLKTHYQKYNSSKWLEPYSNPDLIMITNAKVGFNRHDPSRSLLQKYMKIEWILYRWIEIEFKDQITGSNLGSLKCYPSQVNEYNPAREKLYGNYYYHEDQTAEENAQQIKSGLTIADVLSQLDGYVQIMKTN